MTSFTDNPKIKCLNSTCGTYIIKGSQPFWFSAHLFYYTCSASHLKQFSMLFHNCKYLAAHLKNFNGTLLCRGTPLLLLFYVFYALRFFIRKNFSVCDDILFDLLLIADSVWRILWLFSEAIVILFIVCLLANKQTNK